MASAELALEVPAGPLRLAVDDAGHRHLLVPVSPEERLIGEWRSAGVQLNVLVKVVDDQVVRFLDLECRRDDLTGVFTGLAADICALIAKDRHISGRQLSAVLESWRKLLSGGQVWTVPRLAGLYGELVVLERLLDADPTATETWVGPTGAPQDFRRRVHALEVKTTTSAVGRTIRVHGTDQLERSENGSLTLLWSRFAVRPHGAADDLPAIVERCLQKAASALLLHRLDEIGLPSLTSEGVRGVSFELSERRIYDVGPNFPRITPDRFVAGIVPAGVQLVEYAVDLDTVPASNLDLTTVARTFMEIAS